MIGKKLVLKGVSRKGKNRVRENGNPWIIEKIQDSVMFSQKTGQWLLISLESDSGKWRWIQRNNDSDFEIIDIL